MKIWQHHWLPRKHPPLVLSPMVDTLADANVAILIEENSRQWNHELIDGIFTPLEAELIKALPLSQLEAEDNLFWPFTGSGIYSSKSGYRFLKAEGQPVDDEQQRARDSSLWRTIWPVPVPNKIKNLMWRACRNSLPTKDNLVR